MAGDPRELTIGSPWDGKQDEIYAKERSLMGEDESPEFGDDDEVDIAPGKPDMTTRAGLPDPDDDESEFEDDEPDDEPDDDPDDPDDESDL